MLEILKQFESEGWVRGVKHQSLPLIVWNYTPIVQFEKLFSKYDFLRSCRGLVTDLDGKLVASGFKKFWNWEEHNAEDFPNFSSKCEVTEKMDGSLLIVFRYSGEVVYTTRGSFYSDQAVAGGELFRQLYNEDWIDEGYSYLFEYISPENRIVVSYDTSDLIHLAKLDNSTGFDVERDSRFKCVNVVKMHLDSFSDVFANYSKLKSLNSPNKEGFVIRALSDGVQPDWRCKIKFEDYTKLHKIVTGISNKSVWEMLRDGMSIDFMLEICPDEFNDWLRLTKDGFEKQYSLIEANSKAIYESLKNISSRKEQAQLIMSNHKEFSAVVFKMLDGKDYSGLIWDMVKPGKYYQPFSNKGEE